MSGCGKSASFDLAECDDGEVCGKHFDEAMDQNSWLQHVSRSAATGVLSLADRQDITDAGRGHLLRLL